MPGFPIKNNDFVYRPGLIIMRLILAEEPQLVVGIPATIADPLAPDDIVTWHPVAGSCFGRRSCRPNLRHQLWRHPFIGVYKEHPVTGRKVLGGIALAGKTHEWLLEDFVRILPTDFHGSVGTQGVQHNELIRPSHALQATVNLLFFVFRDDNYRNHPTSALFPDRLSASQRPLALPTAIFSAVFG